jgi:hypothetical protein
MALNLVNLDDEEIRILMLKEVEEDEIQGKTYFSPRLKEDCTELYLKLLKDSIKQGNDESLATEILQSKCLKSAMPRKNPSGIITIAKTPSDAHFTLAEGEFNRYYLRALCLKAIENKDTIEVYRAKAVQSPRNESEALIGKIIDANTLLADLRINIGVDTALGLPSGPNSGLSGRIKK